MVSKNCEFEPSEDDVQIGSVRGVGAPSGGVAHAQGDHRMAMALAVAALAGRSASRVEGADAVGISYPGFWATLERLVA